MSLLSWIEQKVFTGEVIRDYGVIDERKEGMTRKRTSVLLCRKNGTPQVVIRNSMRALLGAGVSYSIIPLTTEVIRTMADVLEDASELVHDE